MDLLPILEPAHVKFFDYDSCSEVNWLLNGEDQWTIIPMDNENTYSVYNSGMLSTLNVSTAAAIRPTLYLNSNVIKKRWNWYKFRSISITSKLKI